MPLRRRSPDSATANDMLKQLTQMLSALFVAMTPLLVVSVAKAVTMHHARRVHASVAVPRRLILLRRATVGVALTAATVAWLLPAPSLLMMVVQGAAFVSLSVIAVPCLSELERVSRLARVSTASQRQGSLRPRRLADYVPLAWRVSPISLLAIGCAVLTWRALVPGALDRPLVPLGFAGAAVVFLCLYHVWLRELVERPVIAAATNDDDERHRTIHMVFAAQLVLVGVCVGVANATLGLDWTVSGTTGATLAFGGGLICVVGCALAVASPLGRREYARAETGK